MVTTAKQPTCVAGRFLYPTSYFGTSTDSKPAAANGSLFKEIDTGKEYRYSAADATWYDPSATPDAPDEEEDDT